MFDVKNSRTVLPLNTTGDVQYSATIATVARASLISHTRTQLSLLPPFNGRLENVAHGYVEAAKRIRNSIFCTWTRFTFFFFIMRLNLRREDYWLNVKKWCLHLLFREEKKCDRAIMYFHKVNNLTGIHLKLRELKKIVFSPNL